MHSPYDYQVAEMFDEYPNPMVAAICSVAVALVYLRDAQGFSQADLIHFCQTFKGVKHPDYGSNIEYVYFAFANELRVSGATLTSVFDTLVARAQSARLWRQVVYPQYKRPRWQ